MKKLFYIFPLLLCGMLAGCDKKEEYVDPLIERVDIGYVQWINGSDHTVSMALDGWIEKVLAPGDSHVKKGTCDFGTLFSINDVFARRLMIVFDDGPYGGDFFFEQYGAEALNPGMPCNYVESRYDEKPLLTYTFTNADYEAAVARGPMENWQDDAHWGFE